MLKIKSGVINKPPKVVIYGAEGVGKSTLASKFPEPLFIDTEGSTTYMDVRRIDKPRSFTQLVSLVHEVADNPDVCKTLVLDTADWAEQMCVEEVCKKYKKTGIEDFGYGKGYVYLAEEFSRLLSAFDKVIAAGICVVITAHAKMRKFEQPDEMGAYDRWEMKLTKQTAPLLKERCDMLLFCNYQTYVVTTDTDKKKAQGGKRVMFTTHHPCWDAKNRHGLPEVVDLDFSSIAHIFDDIKAAPAEVENKPVSEAPIDKLRALMAESNITEEQIQRVVSEKGHFSPDVPIEEYGDKFIRGWLIKYWSQIINIIQNYE
jgi:GTPase SAR1 family protein